LKKKKHKPKFPHNESRHTNEHVLSARQVATPAPGSPESFAQASQIIGQIAKGLQGFQGLPFGKDSASALQGLADGLGKAGQSAKAGATAVPAAGSAEANAQASAILQGLANGLKGTSWIPFAGTASSGLSGVAGGLAAGAKPAGSA
jgi:hypothetical protein